MELNFHLFPAWILSLKLADSAFHSRGHGEDHPDKIVAQFTIILHSFISLSVTYNENPLMDISLLPFPPSLLQGLVTFI